MKALMWTQCLVMLVLTVVTRSEVAMKQEKKFVGASGDGDEVVLSCEANDLPEECKFYRPDGQLICPELDEEEIFYELTDDEECVEDPNVRFLISSDKCAVAINSVSRDLHFGQWRCQIYSWDEMGETAIVLGEAQEADVEFMDVWGDVTVEMGTASGTTFACKVVSVDGGPMLAPPATPMLWTLDETVVKKSSDYEQNADGEWHQSYTFNPVIPDDEKILSCSVGGEDKMDSIKLFITYFEVLGGSADAQTLEEGQPASLDVAFEAYPTLTDDQVHWMLDTPKGPQRLNLGEELPRFSATRLEEVGENSYKTTLEIKKAAKWDTDASHRLVVSVGGNTVAANEKEVELDIVVKMPEPEPEPEPEPLEEPGELPAVEATTETATSEAEAVSEAKTSGVILLCLLFYCTKCCKKKRKTEGDGEENKEGVVQNDKKDLEAAAPLLEKNNKTDTDVGRAEKGTTGAVEGAEVAESAAEAAGRTEAAAAATVTAAAEARRNSRADKEADLRAKEKELLRSLESFRGVTTQPLSSKDPSINDENRKIQDLATVIRMKEEEEAAARQEATLERTAETRLSQAIKRREDIKDRLHGADPVNSPAFEDKSKDWPASPITSTTVDTNTDDPFNTSPSPSFEMAKVNNNPAFPKGKEWQSMDENNVDHARHMEQVNKIMEMIESGQDTLDPDQITDQMGKIIETIRSGQNSTDNSGPVEAQTSPKSPTVSASTQIPQLPPDQTPDSRPESKQERETAKEAEQSMYLSG